MALLIVTAEAGMAQTSQPDAAKLGGVMQGFPPPQGMRVNKTNAFKPPYLRWAFRNARETSPTAGIRRAHTPVILPERPVGNVDALQFEVEGQPVKLSDYLRDTHTDGFIVLHKGQIVFERYLDGFGPTQSHIWASMTKSVTGLLAAMLIVEGKLDPQAKLATYVPELAGNPFGDATVKKNLDMEVDVAYAPDLPPDLGLFSAVGIIPRRPGAPDNIYDFLKTVSAGKEVGAPDYWFYQNGSPEAVAWSMRRVSGRSWAELVQERIWSKLAEDDAYVQVDSLGTEMASGGLSTTLRDAARFADAVRRAAVGDANAGVSAQAVRLALRPSGNQAGFSKDRLATGKPGYAYGDYWYQVNDGDGSVEAGGRFGQKIYINPRKELSVVKFSSSPDTAPRELHIEEISPTELIRISRHNSNEPYFGKSGGNRFDDPQRRYGTSYFGFTLPCAFAETVLHDEVAGPTGFQLTAAQLDRYVLTFEGEQLSLAALYGPHLKNLGGNAAVSSMTPYDTPQQWSRALHGHPAHVDGFLYMSNHLNDQKALVIFERAKDKLAVSNAIPFDCHPQAPQVFEIFRLFPI